MLFFWALTRGYCRGFLIGIDVCVLCASIAIAIWGIGKICTYHWRGSIGCFLREFAG